MTPTRVIAWITNSGKFYRSKKPIATTEELNRAVARRTLMGDACFRSVYRFNDFNDKQSAIVDKIYIDLDNKSDPQSAIDDASKVASHIGDHVTIYFSGQKGVGMLIKCDPVELIPQMKGSVLRQFTLDLIDETGIKTADHAVMGDLNRVRRVIDSCHQKTGLYAIGLLPSELSDMTIDEIKELATQPRWLDQDIQPSSQVSQQLLTIEDNLLHDRLNKLHKKRMVSDDTFTIIANSLAPSHPDRMLALWFMQSLEDDACQSQMSAHVGSGATPQEAWLLHLVDKFQATGRAATGDRTSEHRSRVHIAKLANECGWSVGQICDIYTGADDYNPAITASMVESCIR